MQRNEESATTTMTCVVCNDLASGIHFGVMVCRACAAFYRRSAVGNRKYVCRYDGDCEISKDIRCCCRACRWNKCQTLGMRSDCVQHHRDRIGSRKKLPGEQQSEIETESSSLGGLSPDETPVSTPVNSTTSITSVTAESIVSTLQGDQDEQSYAVVNAISESFKSKINYSLSMGAEINRKIYFIVQAKNSRTFQLVTSLISEMLCGYKIFVSAQRAGYRITTTFDYSNLLDDQIDLTEGNYYNDIAAIRETMKLVPTIINHHFHPFSQLNPTTQSLLIRQFFCQFLIIHRCYLTSKNFPKIDDPHFMISDNHFASLHTVDKIFAVENLDPKSLAKIFEPTLHRITIMITNPMRKLNLSEEEFCGLMGLCLWNDTLTDLANEDKKSVAITQQKIVSELYTVCQMHACSDMDRSVRFGILCNIVSLTNRLANEMASNFSLVKLSQAFSVDNIIHLFIPQTF